MARLDQLQKLYEADPEDADVCYMLAQEHAKTGDHDKAAAWYDTCLTLDPGYHYAYYHKAKSLEAAGAVDDARTTLLAGLERSTADGNNKASNEITLYLGEID